MPRGPAERRLRGMGGAMKLLLELLNLSEMKYPKDFFHSMTKLSRIFAGYPQEYGFHHHHDKKEFHGTFCTRDCRGKVFKKQSEDNSACYTCEFEPENLLDKHTRHEQILDAVRASTPSHWNYVSMTTFKKCKDPCFTVVHSKTPGKVAIHVRHDFHPSIK